MRWGLLAVSSSLLLSCSQLGGLSLPTNNQVSPPATKPSVDVTSVREIPPRSQQNLTIYLEGQVGRQVPLAGSQVYELIDSTGTIWVKTQGSTLNPGDTVLIQGTVRYQRIPIGGKDLGEVYIEQSEQLFHVPAQPINPEINPENGP